MKQAEERVLLRAKSGRRVGLGHLMRTRAVAEEVRARGGRASLVLDDEESAARLREQGFEAVSVHERPHWAHERAAGAWLDGEVDWTEELRALARRGTPALLVENRTPAREWCRELVYPTLHHVDDAWDRVHAARVLAGPAWIPISREVRAQPADGARDVDLLITFGSRDLPGSTERVLACLPETGLALVVGIGPYMEERRPAIERAAAARGARVLSASEPPAPWMARSRAALTALGTTLYELAHLGVPALILANQEEDRAALEHYRRSGPHRPLGVSSALSDADLARALARELAELDGSPLPRVAGLGPGAELLAERLLAPAARILAA